MPDPLFQLWFAVRYVHVASVALLAGGALIVAAGCLVPSLGADDPLRAATAYEWIFWALIGLAAVTGVSNLGLKGDGLLGPGTSWGRALTTKLGAVCGLLALSLVRADFVIRCAGAAVLPARARAIAAWLYAATVAALLAALWIGLGLAHGRY